MKLVLPACSFHAANHVRQHLQNHLLRRRITPTCKTPGHVHFASQSSDILESSRPGNGQATRQKVGKVDLVVIRGQSSKHSQLAHFMHTITSDSIFKPTCSAAASPQLAKHPGTCTFASQSSDILESSRPGNGQATRQKVGKVDLVFIRGQSSKHSQLAHFMHTITSDSIFKPTCSAAASPQLAKHPGTCTFASQSSDILES